MKKRLLALLMAAAVFAANGSISTAANDTLREAENSGTTSATAVVPGENITQTIAKDTECYYAFKADDTDAFYYFKLTNLSEKGSLHYTLYTDETMTEVVCATNGNRIDWYRGAKETVYDHLGKMAPGATYYLKLKADEDIKYTLGFEKKVDDRADALEAAAAISLGETQTGIIEDSSDCEYFKFTADGSDSYYYFHLTNLAEEGRLNYSLYTDDTLTEIVSATNGNRVDWYLGSKSTLCDDLGKMEGGKTYYLKITGDEGINYNVSFSKKQDDRGDNIGQAANIALGTSLTGVLEDSIDCEYFTITSDDSEAYYLLDMTNLAEEGRLNYTLYTDATSTEVAKDIKNNNVSWYVGSKKNETLHLGKIAGGKTYYLKITGDVDVNYRFTFSKVKDDYADTASAAANMVLDQPVNGAIQESIDADYFVFTTDGSANSYYYLDMTNFAESGNIHYTVYDNIECVTYMKNKNFGNGGNLDWSLGAKKSDRFCLGLISGNKTICIKITGDTGVNYSLKLSKLVDDLANTAASAKNLAVTGKTESYRIEGFEDVDYFKFTTKAAGGSLSIKNLTDSNYIKVKIYNKKSCADSACVYDGGCYTGKTLKIERIKDNKVFAKKTTYYVKITGNTYGNYTISAKSPEPAPAGFKAKATGSKKVTLSWKKDSAAKGYKIYRSFYKDANYKKIATIKSNKTVKYVDKKVKKGITYYYKIVSYGKKGTSADSAVKKVKVK